MVYYDGIYIPYETDFLLALVNLRHKVVLSPLKFSMCNV